MDDLRFDYFSHTDAARCGAFELRASVFAHANDCSAEDASPNCFHLVARDGTHAVGYGKLIVTDPFARIRQICVDPSAQRTGLGSQILERLLLRARDEHATTAWLLARFTALGFYQKFGFVEIGPVMRSEDSAAPHRRMELQLKK